MLQPQEPTVGSSRSVSSDQGINPDVSIVIASVESVRWIRRCLDSVRVAVDGVRSEVFVIDASRDESAEIAEKELGGGRVMRCAPGTLTPELWAVGIERSRGRVVLLTTGHFAVDATWVSSLLSGIDAGDTGVAGRIDLADEASVVDWGVFYLRYSEFLQEPPDTMRPVPGIPADNAAYDGDAIRRFTSSARDGFWEVEFHRQLRASGGTLGVVPNAAARYGRSFPLWTIAAHRFRHGRHAGAWRTTTGQRSALTIVAGAPAVPIALALRAWRRVRGLPSHRTRFVRSLPVFLALATSWAMGEAIGALAGAPISQRTAAAPA
jgi:glycosyl transferase family 2